jgi:hypothetical protein
MVKNEKFKTMSKNNKDCIVCGHGLDEEDDTSVLKVRKGLGVNSSPCYICPTCDSFFRENKTLLDFLNNPDLIRLFHRCMRVTRLVAINAPSVIIANELRVTIKTAISAEPAGFFDDLKRMFFDGESTNPTFTESQTVDLITAAERSLTKKKKKKK